MENKMEEKLATASLNYEAECDRLLRQQEELMKEIDHLRIELKLAESECYRLRAQMDIVYLIFGGRK